MIRLPQYSYPGALHIHTNFSHDCTGPVPHVIEAARQAGLSWVILTDHNSLGAASFEGWHDDVLVIVGNEITPQRNHFLALGLDQVVDHTLPPQDMIDTVYQQGGFGIIAHPDDRITSAVKKNYYAWEDWSIDGPRERDNRTVGIELWNLFSDWGSSLTPYNKYLNFFCLRRGLRGPTAATLAWWDHLNMAGKRTFGVAGVDAHAIKRRAPWGGTIEVFSYKRTFHTLTNYLLLREPLDSSAHVAQRQVFDALMQGRLFFVNRLDLAGSTPNLTCVVSRGSEQWSIGDTFSLKDGDAFLNADVGQSSMVRLIHNGHVVNTGKRSLCWRVDTPGIYRLESYHRSGRPWLFTNPVYVLP